VNQNLLVMKFVLDRHLVLTLRLLVVVVLAKDTAANTNVHVEISPRRYLVRTLAPFSVFKSSRIEK
jgi:hypothetical protein